MKEQIYIPDHIKQLIAGHLSGSLNSEELAILEAWINELPDNKQHFNEIRNIWALSDRRISNSEQLRSVLELSDKVQHHIKRHNPFLTWQKIVASWVVVFIGSWVLSWQLNKDVHAETKHAEPAETVTAIHARTGSQTMMDMPDGTRVWLNGNSKLTYGSSYGELQREVYLTGEGCFEVAALPEKPFIVKVEGGLTIKAHGTTFNVKAYPEDKAVTTTLVKGKVTIEGKDENNKQFSLELKPNENVTYLTEHKPDGEKPQTSQNGETVKNHIPEPVIVENNVNPELFTSWKDDLWIIERQKLGVLSKDFERRYGVSIKFVSAEAMNYHFTGSIQRETIEQVMNIIKRTVPLKYSFDKNVITVDVDKQLAKEFYLKNQ